LLADIEPFVRSGLVVITPAHASVDSESRRSVHHDLGLGEDLKALTNLIEESYFIEGDSESEKRLYAQAIAAFEPFGLQRSCRPGSRRIIPRMVLACGPCE
jgi:hypothetical protein